MTEFGPEVEGVSEGSRAQDAVETAVIPVIEGIENDNQREATSVYFSALADALSTPEGLEKLKADIAIQQESNK